MIKISRASSYDREKIQGMFSYYLYDMSQYTRWEIDDSGRIPFDSSILDPYFNREDHYPYLIYSDSELAGFSLLRRYPWDSSIMDVGQFFILKKFSGQGIGSRAFNLCFKQFTGKWQVRVLDNNIGARDFWLKVIEEVAHDNFTITRELYDNRVSMDFIRFS